MFSVSGGSLREDLGEDPGSWTHIDFTVTRKISLAHVDCFHAEFSPVLIGLFSVLALMCN